MKSYDVIVIGSGGGSKITRPAAQLGFKVAIIEKGRLGGTCLNHGCIPSKMLIHPAEMMEHIRDAKKFDIHSTEPSVDFEKLVTRVNNTIDADSDGIKPMYDAHPNIDLYPHEATFISNNVLKVNGEELTAQKIFISTGARANIPDIPGLKDTPYLTYKEALRLTKQPKSMVVIGGGYIAVELGFFFGAMGTDTTFFVRSQFLRGEDHDIRDAFKKQFSKRFNVHMRTCPSSITHDGNEFEITFQSPTKEKRTIRCEALLVAAGVVPNSDNLHLENTDITTDKNGFIKVNEHLQTDAPGVYAFGDVIGRYLFRHNANFEGEYVFKHVFQGHKAPINYPPVPHAVFTKPQIGGVGATEEELIKSRSDYVVGINDYKKSAMGMAMLPEVGLVKLLFDRNSQKLLGAHIIGDEASNMVHMLIAYMNMGATLGDLLRTIYIHPALPENIRNAARNAKAEFDKLNVL